MKILTLVSSGMGRSRMAEIRALEKKDQYPRISLYEDLLHSDMLDERFAIDHSVLRKHIYQKLDPAIAQSLEAYRLRRRYDAIVTWSERLGLAFAALKCATRTPVPHIMLASWISKRKKAVLLRHLHPWIDRLVLWSTRQRSVAMHRLGVPQSKIAFIRKFADQHFWRPMPLPQDDNFICSVGYEMRDYPTLIEALRGTGVRCHIAAGTGRDVGDDNLRDLIPDMPLPPEITVGRLTPVALRELYARSRFVVVPIRPTDTDNGLTCILESMAMGRAVICSAVEGQVDVIRHGLNGLYVPPEDPAAMRQAILQLLSHPEEADCMGRAGREQIEREHTIEGFILMMKNILEEATHAGSPSRENAVREALGVLDETRQDGGKTTVSGLFGRSSWPTGARREW